MVTAKNVVDNALWPSRKVDNYVLVRGSKVLKRVPAVWNRIPQRVKDQLKNPESPTRRTLDSIVTVGVPFGVLAVVDRLAGPGVAPYQAIGHWYANSTLFAAGITTGAVTAIVDVTNRAWHYIPNRFHVALPKIGQTAYTTIAGTAAVAILLISSAFSGPSAPSAARQLTEEQLKQVAGYLASQGLAGPQGPSGAAGSAGPQGVDGASGGQGPQGPAGIAGLVGSAGPQGAQGPAGATGVVDPSKLEKAVADAVAKYFAGQGMPTPTPTPPTPTPQPTPGPAATPVADELVVYFNGLVARAEQGQTAGIAFYRDQTTACYKAVAYSIVRDAACKVDPGQSRSRTFTFGKVQTLESLAGLVNISSLPTVPEPRTTSKGCDALGAYNRPSADVFGQTFVASVKSKMPEIVATIRSEGKYGTAK